MNTVKDLLLNNLTKNGFTYYPSMKRLMLKGANEVMVIEMDQTDACRVYYNNASDLTLDRTLNYDAQAILAYVNNLLSRKTANLQTAA